MSKSPRMSWQLRAYATATSLARPLIMAHLRRRVRTGKELSERWTEKLGVASLPRPDGKLVWLHAVGLGEALALRGIITLMQNAQPDLNFLLTTSTRSAAEALADKLPPQTQHQFLPLDSTRFIRRFLTHWSPDLAIWSEQDIWPLIVHETACAGIHQALINARINDASFAKRQKARKLYAGALSRMSLASAQDTKTAQHLKTLGAENVRIDGSIKPIAPALPIDPLLDAKLKDEIRPFWIVAPSHPDDENIALASHFNTTGDRTLVLAPRDITRANDIFEQVKAQGKDCTVASKDTDLGDVHIIDQFGTLGTWYKHAEFALIGGTFSPTIQGHNPWESLRLGCPIAFGPNTDNFKEDYDTLTQNGIGVALKSGNDLSALLMLKPRPAPNPQFHDLLQSQSERVKRLTRDLLELLQP